MPTSPAGNIATVDLDSESARAYLAECPQQTAIIKTGLLALQNCGSEIDQILVNQLFAAVHSIRGGGLFGLVTVCSLAKQMEEMLGMLRSRKMAPTSHRIRLLLQATDMLHELTRHPHAGNQVQVPGILDELAMLCSENRAVSIKNRTSKTPTPDANRLLRSLLVEDDAASRLLLQTFLSRHGKCQPAANGREAVEAFKKALEEGHAYQLVCMDIMMPEMNGREALREIRALEAASVTPSKAAAKIIMTTAVTDAEEVFLCFRESCDAYLLKPIDLGRLLAQLKTYRLVQ